MDEATKATVAIFKDNKGNEFIIPGCWYTDDPDSDSINAHFNAMAYGVTTNTKHEWWDFPVVNGTVELGIDGVRTTLISRAFEHGGFDVWLTAGPLYDQGTAYKSRGAHQEEEGEGGDPS